MTMLRIALITITGFCFTPVFAQQFTSADESDPKAKAVLDKLQKKYEAFQSLEASFTLELEIPEKETEVQKGTLFQEGDKYRLTLADRTLVCDGKTVWLYLPKQKEVQINDMETEQEGSFNSPKDLLKAYQWKNHIYVLVDEFVQDGRSVQFIEFKPVSKSAEYSKVRLTVDKKANDIVSISTFNKDGSRYTLIIGKIASGNRQPAGTFTFSKSNCPDCHFEDLRI